MHIPKSHGCCAKLHNEIHDTCERNGGGQNAQTCYEWHIKKLGTW